MRKTFLRGKESGRKLKKTKTPVERTLAVRVVRRRAESR